MALRVAMVAPPFVPIPPVRYGGTELVVSELIDSLVESGVEVTLFASGDSSGGFRHAIPVHSVFPRSAWPPSPYIELVHVAACAEALGSFELVHSHAPSLLPITRSMAVPIVATMHHEQLDDLTALYLACPWVRFAAISERQRELCLLPDATVIHHGLDASRYRLGSVDPHSLVFIGRLSREKGPHTAIDVARAVGMTIHVAGKPHPDDRDYHAHEFVPRLREPHVVYHREVDHEQKISLLSSARALLLPLAWEEPFGLVALEAMLCGCPVVAFDRGAMPELIEPGVTGFLARDKEAMADLVATACDPERFDRARCRESAARRFSPMRMAEGYLRLYRDALAYRATPRSEPSTNPSSSATSGVSP